MLTLTNNAGGGQPVSLANIRATAELARRYRKKLVLDIARFAENAWFIKQREAGLADVPLPDIVRRTMADADAVLMSAKKDAIANIGGFVAVRDDEEFFRRLQARGIVFEGFPTYGGLAGRDLEAIAVGLREVLDEDVPALPDRAGRLSRTRPRGAPGPRSFGPSAATRSTSTRARCCPHIPPPQFPAQALTCALYLAAGVRAVEIGSVMAGRDPETGENRHPPLELVRLAVPRRVYTSRQLELAAEAAAEVVDRSGRRPRARDRVRGAGASPLHGAVSPCTRARAADD